MNDTFNNFDDTIRDLAAKGLAHRLADGPSPAAAAAFAAHAAAHARHTRLMRRLRRLAAAAAPIAACAALVFLHLGAPARPEPATVADGVRPMAALVALATIVTEVETADGTLDAVVSDVTFGPDFDAFAEGVVLMQESACGLDAMLASE